MSFSKLQQFSVFKTVNSVPQLITAVSDLLVNYARENVYTNQQSNLSQKLEEAQTYSLYSGKKLRPSLLIGIYSALISNGRDELKDNELKKVIPMALAIEMFHAYSLIHDDLPSMDNSNLRRGKPTNHMVYQEWGALLAGNSLQAKSFEILSDDRCDLPTNTRLKLINKLSIASGDKGVMLGQFADMTHSSNMNITLDELRFIDEYKTAKLFELTFESAGIIVGLPEEANVKLRVLGSLFGKIYQIYDDLQDILSSEEIGKQTNLDIQNDKPTYLSILGVDNSINELNSYVKQAESLIDNERHDYSIIMEFIKYLVKPDFIKKLYAQQQKNN